MKLPIYLYLIAVILIAATVYFLSSVDLSTYFPVEVSRRISSLRWLLGALGGLLVIATSYYKWRHPQSVKSEFYIFAGSIVALIGLLLTEPPKATSSDVEALAEALRDVLVVNDLPDADSASTKTAETVYRSSTDPFELGLALFRFGNIESSLEYFQAASVRAHYSRDKQANIEYYRGNCLFLLERYEEALDAYRRSVELNSNDSDAYNNMGLTHMALNDPEAAIIAYENAVSVDPQYDKAWINLSSTLSELGRMEEAEKSFSKVSRLRENTDYIWNEGVVLKLCMDIFLDADRRAPDNKMVQGYDRAISLIGKQWPNGSTIPVTLIGLNDTLVEKIIDISNEWSKHANIKFIGTNDPEAVIRISFTPGPSWSYLGTDAFKAPKDQATMNLGWVTHDIDVDVLRSLVLHVFGHVLGLSHEHHVPMDGIKWNVPEVRRYYAGSPNFLDEQQIEKLFLDKYKVDQINGVRFDPASIMRMPIPAAWTRNGYSVGWNRGISEEDSRIVSNAAFYPK